MQHKIYLINLERAKDRLAAMCRKLDELGLSFERIEATDGRVMSTEEKIAFAKLRPRANGWLPGAIGCFRSHYKVWTAIAEGEEDFGVVFEDDVHISAALPNLLNGIGAYLDQFDIVRLEATKHRVWLNTEKKMSVGQTKLVEVRSETWGSAAYVLSREAARLLVVEPTTNHSPVDFFLFDKDTSVVARRHRIYQTVPALCVQAKFNAVQGKPDTSQASDIEHNSEDTSLRHLVRKLQWRVRGFRNMLIGYRRIALSEDIVHL